MPFQGDILNSVPNIGLDNGNISQELFQNPPFLSDKLHDVNRAQQVRRDTDSQKDVTISLLDIDTAIKNQLEKFQLTVTDDGNQIKVPVYYASPEKWKSIQKDGILRDYNGKMILPAIVFQRITSEKDTNMMMFNRYLNYSVIRLYSEKNRYTQFKTLMGKNSPVHEVYDIVMPDHMVFIYHFIIWTEYIQQMNPLIEKINFETEDYWGDKLGFRFRTKIDSFSHTVELQTDQDRIVKTEFDLTVNGYLLPDIINLFSGNKNTTQKRFIPKKVVLGMEITEGELRRKNKKNQEKWKNQNYPNISLNSDNGYIGIDPIIFRKQLVGSTQFPAQPSEIPTIPTSVPITFPQLQKVTPAIKTSPPLTYTLPPSSNGIWDDSQFWNDLLIWND